VFYIGRGFAIGNTIIRNRTFRPGGFAPAFIDPHIFLVGTALLLIILLILIQSASDPDPEQTEKDLDNFYWQMPLIVVAITIVWAVLVYVFFKNI
jgi:hypothetical protein